MINSQLFALECSLYYYEELRVTLLNHWSKTRNNYKQFPKSENRICDKNTYIVAIKSVNTMPKDFKVLAGDKTSIKR